MVRKSLLLVLEVKIPGAVVFHLAAVGVLVFFLQVFISTSVQLGAKLNILTVCGIFSGQITAPILIIPGAAGAITLHMKGCQRHYFSPCITFNRGN
jgi:hypothetical protein